MTEFVRPTNLEMAARLRALQAPCPVTDGIIFRMLEEVEGDVWSDLLDSVDDVWWRRDPHDRGAWDRPPAYTTSFDIAMERKFPGVRLVSLEEQPLGDGLDPSWRQWRCTLKISFGDELFEGRGVNPAIALLEALFRVGAVITGEDRA